MIMILTDKMLLLPYSKLRKQRGRKLVGIDSDTTRRSLNLDIWLRSKQQYHHMLPMISRRRLWLLHSFLDGPPVGFGPGGHGIVVRWKSFLAAHSETMDDAAKELFGHGQTVIFPGVKEGVVLRQQGLTRRTVRLVTTQAASHRL